MTSDSADGTIGDPVEDSVGNSTDDRLAPFREYQATQRKPPPQYLWHVWLFVCLVLGLCIYRDQAAKTDALSGTLFLSLVSSLGVWSFGAMLFLPFRPQAARTSVRVDGEKLTISRSNTALPTAPMVVFQLLIGAGMVFVAETDAAKDSDKGPAIPSWAFLCTAAIVVASAVFLFMTTLGKTQIIITGTTLIADIGQFVHATVLLNTHHHNGLHFPGNADARCLCLSRSAGTGTRIPTDYTPHHHPWRSTSRAQPVPSGPAHRRAQRIWHSPEHLRRITRYFRLSGQPLP